MKRILVASLLLVSLNCFAQSKPEITNQFTVEGLVKNPAAISIAELSRYASHSIDSVVVKNHLMEKKRRRVPVELKRHLQILRWVYRRLLK